MQQSWELMLIRESSRPCPSVVSSTLQSLQCGEGNVFTRARARERQSDVMDFHWERGGADFELMAAL